MPARCLRMRRSSALRRRIPVVGAALVSLGLCSHAAFAQPASQPRAKSNPLSAADVFTDAGGTGLWSTSANWSIGLPNSGDDVYITGAGGAASVTQDTSATINNLTLNSGNSWTLDGGQTLTIDGSSISNAGNMALKRERG